jgi:hypothetical protein
MDRIWQRPFLAPPRPSDHFLLDGFLVRVVACSVVMSPLNRVSAAVLSARYNTLHDLRILRGSRTGVWATFSG